LSPPPAWRCRPIRWIVAAGLALIGLVGAFMPDRFKTAVLLLGLAARLRSGMDRSGFLAAALRRAETEKRATGIAHFAGPP